MTSHEIRQQFLDFFKEKGHLIVPSAPLVLQNDPSLMFVNSGMAQFKDFFLGNKTAPSARIADTQKCLRVTGKHNDLEDVGHDTYHHTLFEMLGNWSFGDYFKKEAIEWSWQLLTEVFKLPKNRLYATVFEGDASENLDPDSEAYELWKQFLPESQILFGNKKDNFWEMGEVGPCGPCSEIHIDLRDESEIAQKPGRELVNQDNPQVVEIWNNVFMQFERKADKSLVVLPAQHVDTGMGFERLCMAIQGKKSNYDTDIFQPIIQFVAQKAQTTYGNNPKTDIALRVIADHIRAVAFAIADGQMLASTGAGYVIRRILRRAIRYGYSYLNFQEPFMHRLVPLLSVQFEAVFPELKAQEDFVKTVIFEEEKAFLRTLENGLKRLDMYFETNTKTQIMEGKTVFELYDTYGFPKDLTALIAKEKGLEIDEIGFEKELEQQKNRSRNAQTSETTDWVQVRPDTDTTFVGYDETESISEVIKYRLIKNKDKQYYQIVLNKTPFYAESGGQVGDTGVFEIVHTAEQTQGTGDKILVIDTKKENDLIVHLCHIENKNVLQLLENNSIIAKINTKKRMNTVNNHSATHLLQAALRQVLGSHIVQKGSLVNEHLLRFDFAHFAKMTKEEITAVEKIVNEKIRENITLDERRNVPIAEATEKMGATALFGEKYGDFVRVITFGEEFSRELCGGTHAKATGQIGFFKILSESSISAGVRRIEAVTAQIAENTVYEQFQILENVKELLKNPKDLSKSITTLLQERQQLSKKLENFALKQAQAEKARLIEKIELKEKLHIVISRIEVDNFDYVKQIAFELKNQVDNLFAVLVAVVEGKPQITVIISDNVVRDRNLHAVTIVKDLAKEIKGGGGGQAFYATAGGQDASGVEKVLEKAKELFR